jgi:hypothetical protein
LVKHRDNLRHVVSTADFFDLNLFLKKKRLTDVFSTNHANGSEEPHGA